MDQLTTDMEALPPEMADMLPEEVRQMIAIQNEKRLQRIESIGASIAKKRDEAIEGRKNSGIEDVWAEDEDFYQGYDDANKDQAKVYKSPSLNGGLTTVRNREPGRSTVFLNITRPYVDAAAARVSDMLLPTDDRNWSIKPTPVPQLADMEKSGASRMVQTPQGMQQVPEADIAKQIKADASDKAERAQTQIEDWLLESNWHGEVRKVIEDCARLGTGVIKGPVPVKRKMQKVQDDDGSMVLQMEISICPESKRIDLWNLYPDPACGENIHNGSHLFEHDEISVRQLKDLKGVPGYLSEQIDKVIEEGPNKRNVVNGRIASSRDQVADHETYSIWYYYGFIDKDDLEAMGFDGEDVSQEGIPAIVTLINDTPIKAALNPLDSGEFPYDVMPWQRRTGHWAGVGVARQIRTPQAMLNAATRNMMDNAGLSGAPQIVLWKNKITPADGSWALTRGKLWFAKEDADIKGVSDAFASFVIPSMQAELSNIIQFAMKMAEDTTGLPQLMQGSVGNQAPDTVGGMNIVMNNASTVLRRIAKLFDDNITRPHIRRYYQWLMTFHEDESIKGDFTIDARGSSALVERDLSNQAILGMGQLVMNPAFGIDPQLWFEEACKAQRLDPRKFLMTDEKKKELAQQQQTPPPQIAIAQIRAASAEKIAAMRNETDQIRIKTDTDRDTVYAQVESRRDQMNAAARIEELRLKKEIAALEAQLRKGIAVDDAKVRLSDTVLKLKTQKELAYMNARQVANPPVEPPGRAENGKAYFQ